MYLEPEFDLVVCRLYSVGAVDNIATNLDR